MFNLDRSAKELQHHDTVAKAVERKIEETLYHLVCLEVLADKLFKKELNIKSISDMTSNMLQLLKESRRTS